MGAIAHVAARALRIARDSSGGVFAVLASGFRCLRRTFNIAIQNVRDVGGSDFGPRIEYQLRSLAVRFDAGVGRPERPN